MDLSIKKAYEFIVNQYAPASSKDAGFSDLITSEKLYKIFLSNYNTSGSKVTPEELIEAMENGDEEKNIPSLKEFENTLESKGYQYMLVSAEKNWMIK